MEALFWPLDSVHSPLRAMTAFSIFGRHGRGIIRNFFCLDTADPDNQRLIDEKEESHRNFYSQQCLLPCLAGLMGRADAAGVALTVATVARRENVSCFHIHQRFSAIICAKDAWRGKPGPDVFLAAAAALQLEPGDCLVFEDSLL